MLLLPLGRSRARPVVRQQDVGGPVHLALRRRGQLVHDRLQVVVVALGGVRVQGVEVVGLVRRRVQLGVQEARRQHRVQRVVAVGARVGGRRHVLVQREVGVVDVGGPQVGLREEVVLDGALRRAGVVREGPGAGYREVGVVRGVPGDEQRRRVGAAARGVGRVGLRGDEPQVLVQVPRRRVRQHWKETKLGTRTVTNSAFLHRPHFPQLL